jgi:hypothetical protein
VAGNIIRIGQEKNVHYVTKIKTNKIKFLGRSTELSTIYLVHVAVPIGPL